MKHEKRPRTTTQKRPAVLPREVKILFNGLFFFSFLPANGTGEEPYKRDSCTVGILSTRWVAKSDHSLFIKFREGDYVSDRIEIPHCVLSKMPEEIEITRCERSDAPDVTIRGYGGRAGWGAPPDRNITNNPDYFNWIIDFEALHDKDLAESVGSLRPKLRFKTGDFYTALISNMTYSKQQGDIVSPFGYVAAILGAKIVLGEMEKVILRVGDVEYSLPLSVTEVWLNNVRPEHLPSVERMEADLHRVSVVDSPHTPAQHVAATEEYQDDSQIYYHDLLQGVLPSERFHFIPADPKRSEPFVCYGSGGSLP